MNRYKPLIFLRFYKERFINKCREEKIYFKELIVKEIVPDESKIKDNEFIEVIYKKNPFWVMFKCPCGCQYIISLPLQQNHNPHWRLKISKNGRPSLYPSIWQTTGCLSHFVINDGRVYWVNGYRS